MQLSRQALWSRLRRREPVADSAFLQHAVVFGVSCVRKLGAATIPSWPWKRARQLPRLASSTSFLMKQALLLLQGGAANPAPMVHAGRSGGTARTVIATGKACWSGFFCKAIVAASSRRRGPCRQIWDCHRHRQGMLEKILCKAIIAASSRRSLPCRQIFLHRPDCPCRQIWAHHPDCHCHRQGKLERFLCKAIVAAS